MSKIETEHGRFSESKVTGQTAEEVYRQWLEDKNKPPIPTKIEILEQEISNTNAMVLDLTEFILGGM